MAKTITMGVHKGGASKTTSTAITAWILSQNYRVLVCDLDAQANLTQTFTQVDPNEEFQDRTILEAIKDRDPQGYIVPITDTLHVLPSDDFISTLPSFLYSELSEGQRATRLRHTLKKVSDQYDFIFLDIGPTLGDHAVNALAATDYVVVMFEPSIYCYNAIPRFLGLCQDVQTAVNPSLDVIGILRVMFQQRRGDTEALSELVKEEYSDLVFDTEIRRRAAAGRLAFKGFQDNPETKEIVRQYRPFVKELLERLDSNE